MALMIAGGVGLLAIALRQADKNFLRDVIISKGIKKIANNDELRGNNVYRRILELPSAVKTIKIGEVKYSSPVYVGSQYVKFPVGGGELYYDNIEYIDIYDKGNILENLGLRWADHYDWDRKGDIGTLSHGSKILVDQIYSFNEARNVLAPYIVDGNALPYLSDKMRIKITTCPKVYGYICDKTITTAVDTYLLEKSGLFENYLEHDRGHICRQCHSYMQNKGQVCDSCQIEGKIRKQ